MLGAASGRAGASDGSQPLAAPARTSVSVPLCDLLVHAWATLVVQESLL